MSSTVLKKKASNTENDATDSFLPLETRQSYNYASLLHLSGMSIITGLPLINILVPTGLWLLKKEADPIIDLHGRVVINFQITITILQILLLCLGTMLIWLVPNFVKEILDATRTLKIVFSTAYYLPFNLFTFIPFIFAIILGIVGSIAAYYGEIAPSLFGFKFLSLEDFTAEMQANEPEPEPIKPSPQSSAPPNNMPPPKRTSFG